jgi:hypothetical protein
MRVTKHPEVGGLFWRIAFEPLSVITMKIARWGLCLIAAAALGYTAYHFITHTLQA